MLNMVVVVGGVCFNFFGGVCKYSFYELIVFVLFSWVVIFILLFFFILNLTLFLFYLYGFAVLCLVFAIR